MPYLVLESKLQAGAVLYLLPDTNKNCKIIGIALGRALQDYLVQSNLQVTY